MPPSPPPFARRSLTAGSLVAALLCVGVAVAQQNESGADEPIESPTITVDSQDGVIGKNTAAQDDLTTPELTPVDEPASFYSTIDELFGKGVEAMVTVLFFGVTDVEREFVQYTHEEPYVRTTGTEDPFKPLNQFDRSLPQSLNVVEASQFNRDGRLAGGGTPLDPLRGTINGRDVDYLLLKIPHRDPLIPSGSTYVKDGDVWKRETAKRGLLDDDDTLTDEQVEQLADIWTVPEGADTYRMTKTIAQVPVIVLWLVIGALFFTFRMSFVNLWAFGHAVQIVRGKYDDPNETGEVTHAQALASALSATVGLGNISGVAVAMTIGGPGAFFWMLLCGFFGMASKFVECTLAQKYRAVDGDDGSVLGGPMRYLSVGLAKRKLGWLGSILAVVFAVMCIGASFGGGIMFQSNQSAEAFIKALQQNTLDEQLRLEEVMEEAAANEDGVAYTQARDKRNDLRDEVESIRGTARVGFGLVMAIAVALVIIGGIKRIGATAEKIVPAMCGIYLLACGYVILHHLPEVPAVAASVFTEAFNGKALGGGFAGVLIVAVMGLRRAAFSNEAGIGSAAIAHSAAKTSEPVREGCVAMLGPFIDTIIVCSMTALVILLTGAWDNTEWVVDRGLEGASLTSQAFRSEIEWFPYVLAVATVLFAFSSIIAWSYYGEKATEYLFGRKAVPIYKLTATAAVFIGAIVTQLGAIIDFSDMMLLSMAVPNILGAAILSGEVKTDLLDYWRRYRSGAFDAVYEENTTD